MLFMIHGFYMSKFLSGYIVFLLVKKNHAVYIMDHMMPKLYSVLLTINHALLHELYNLEFLSDYKLSFPKIMHSIQRTTGHKDVVG